MRELSDIGKHFCAGVRRSGRASRGTGATREYGETPPPTEPSIWRRFRHYEVPAVRVGRMHALHYGVAVPVRWARRPS